MVKKYSVTGMTCSACSSGIERAMGRLDGVSSCEVSLMAKSMKVDFDESVVSEEKIFSVVKELGYGIYNEGEQPEGKAQNRDNKLFIRFIISVCLLAPLLYVSMGHMIKAPVPFFLNPHKGYGQWFALYQCILAAAVIAVNFSFFKNGIVAVFKRVPNMDTLVALGSGASFIYSLVLTVLIFVGNSNGNPSWSGLYSDLHFESAATILALVTVGKWLEEKSKKKTGTEIEKLLKLAPDTVTVECDGVRKTVPVKEVKVGDIVVVKQGEYVPVDGIITDGHGFVDKCAVTGESLPVEVTSGDAVTSAAIVTNGVLKLRAERVGDQTTLSKIIEMVREAGASKAPIQKLADKIAGIFVPVVTAIALITFLVWLLIDGGFRAEHCVTYAISVLVVSCPCALGLATPVAIMTATGKAASLGILYKDAESLQRVCGINSVLLDKTATLTLGKPQVTDVCVFGCDREEILKIACGIERNSNHPLAKCVVEYVGDGAEVSDFSYIVGQGARAVYGGEIYSLGNIKLVTGVKISKEVKDSAANLSAQGKTVLYMADSKRVVALIAVADVIKEGSGQAISMLKDRNMKIAMLTGDEIKTAQAVAASVGIDDFVAEVMPEDKLNAVVNLQNAGGCVAMVGDGINDSPALKQADVGIAMGSGTDVAIDSADVILVGEDLRTLDTVFDLSRATVRNIKENLFWAFIYNVVMIPVAAGAFSALGFSFNPMIAALCMSLSSLFVVGNALRLLRYRNKKIIKEDKYMKKIIHIEGMCCEHCAKRVENALSAVSGVVSADVKLKKKTAVVRSREEIDEAEISKVISEAGYTVTAIDNK
ncbi:MAG: heavy metal translocating P-type ATPase [Clostridia bacterium]|nr:heavy metal translocating P-type ATPase [Clostridia bacterium]